MSELSKRLTILLGAAALAGGGTAIAQGGGYGQQQGQGQERGGYQAPPQQSQQGAGDFSEEQLRAFAEAQQEIESINQEFQQKMQNTEDPAKMSEMRQKVNREMVETVQSAGLEPAQYNTIARAVRSNPELEEKVEELQ